MKIPYHQYSFSEEESEAVKRVMASGWITTGPEVAMFEQELAQYTQAPLALTVNSCTAALHLIIASLNLSPDDEVITTAFTFSASANIILHNHAQVVFADIDPYTLTIDIKEVRKKITSKTKAILLVHYAGHLCDMDAFIRLSQETGIPLVEDCAHALGAKWRGIHAGLLGYAGAFSFYANKNITTGEGGCIITSNTSLSSYFLSMRNHGFDIEAYARMANSGFRQYDIIEPGFKYNLSDILAAIGRIQLKKIDSFAQKRKKIVQNYIHAFDNNNKFRIIKPLEPCESAWHLFAIQLDTKKIGLSRNEIVNKCIQSGVQVSVHFKPVHQMSLYRRIATKPIYLPHTEKAGQEIISLPLYPDLSLEAQNYVIQVIQNL